MLILPPTSLLLLFEAAEEPYKSTQSSRNTTHFPESLWYPDCFQVHILCPPQPPKVPQAEPLPGLPEPTLIPWSAGVSLAADGQSKEPFCSLQINHRGNRTATALKAEQVTRKAGCFERDYSANKETC